MPANVQLAIIELHRGNASNLDAYRLARLDELHDIVSASRVDVEFLDSWNNTNTGRIYSGISVYRDGGFGAEQGPRAIVGSAQARVIIRYWASYMHTAMAMADIGAQLLYPAEHGLGSSFIAASTFIESCTGVSAPIEYQEPGETNPFKVAAQVQANFRYRRLAVA
jgi:hypothetical protein